MQSDGGLVEIDAGAEAPVRLVESGPAGGALAAAWYGQLLGHADVIAFDMGGTMELDMQAAETAIRTRVAEPLGLSLLGAAWGIHQLVGAEIPGEPRQYRSRSLPGSVADSAKKSAWPGGRRPCDSALASWFCSHPIASVRTHGPTAKACSTTLASPTTPSWRVGT